MIPGSGKFHAVPAEILPSEARSYYSGVYARWMGPVLQEYDGCWWYLIEWDTNEGRSWKEMDEHTQLDVQAYLLKGGL